MPNLPADWELVSRKALSSARSPFDAVRRLFSGTEAAGQAAIWTVRHKATGLIRQITARTELEAGVKIANGLFDAA